MKHKIFPTGSLLTLLCTSLLCSCAVANQPQSTAITEDKVNLSGTEFLPEFIHQSPERRSAARLYLLGVLDSTEGKTWCSYNQLKTVTLNEFVFEYLKKLPAERLQARASTLIEEALQNTFPCKDIQ